MTDSMPDSVSRRAVLRKSAATGALLVGGTGIAGSATAHLTGGNAVMSVDVYRHRTPFEVVAQIVESADFPASCVSFNSATKKWDAYTIKYDEDDEEPDGRIDVREHKSVEIGDEYEFTTANPVECENPDFVKAAFKPVR